MERINLENPDQSQDEIATDRTFNLFFSEDGSRRETTTRQIGDINKFLVPEDSSEKKCKFTNSKQIIDAFHDARVEHSLENGSTISRRPHLLICGGFVRDMLLGVEPKDMDFATNIEYTEVRKILEARFKTEIEEGKISLGEQGKAFGVIRIRFRDTEEEYEIASFREDGKYEDGRRPKEVTPVKHAGIDADRRDLTINALFYDPNSGNVVDFVGGLKDIDEKTLRFVGSAEKRIEEDKLRMLRFVRFMLKTGFSPDESALEAIRAHSAEVLNIVPERIRDELDKIFRTGKPGDALRVLKTVEILRHVLPEVDELSSCEQGPPYHLEGDVFEHTVLVANNLDHLATKKDGLSLRWATILHDIGKPKMRREELKGGEKKVSFIGHDEEGVRMLGAIFARLKFSNADARAIEWLVAEHQQAFRLAEMRQSKADVYFENPEFENLLRLAEADILGSEGTPELRQSNLELIGKIKSRYSEYKKSRVEDGDKFIAVEKALNGKEIIRIFSEVVGRNPDPKTELKPIKDMAIAIAKDEGVTDVEVATQILRQIIEQERWPK